MNFSKTTKVITIVATTGMVAWTSLMMFISPTSTISTWVHDLALDHPMLPFTLGVLVGHWFFPSGSNKSPRA
jgi:hypothetical protein